MEVKMTNQNHTQEIPSNNNDNNPITPAKDREIERLAAIANGETKPNISLSHSTYEKGKQNAQKQLNEIVNKENKERNTGPTGSAKEALTSSTRPLDPAVTQTAGEIQAKINNEIKQINNDPNLTIVKSQILQSALDGATLVDHKPKPITPTGRERQERTPGVNPNRRMHNNNMNSMEDEANKDSFIPHEVIKQIKDIAAKNPVTKKLIEDAKTFTAENREEIYKQCTDIVALYNISHKKPFFFITPAEARLAIDYVKKCREGYVTDLENEHAKDIFVYDYMNQVQNLIRDHVELPDISDVAVKEAMQTDIDAICGLEMGELQGTITGDKLRQMNKDYDLVEAFKSTIGANDEFTQKQIEEINETLSKSKSGQEDIDIDIDEAQQLPKFYIYKVKMKINGMGNVDVLSLSMINRIFSIIENNDVTVDVMMMNSFRIADIRNFGKTVYDEYSKKELLRRKVFGKLFTAEMYPCNKLADNQIVFGCILPSAPLEKGIFLNVLLYNEDK